MTSSLRCEAQLCTGISLAMTRLMIASLSGEEMSQPVCEREVLWLYVTAETFALGCLNFANAGWLSGGTLLFWFRWSTGKWMFQGSCHHSVYFPWLPPPKAIHSKVSWPRGAPQWEFAHVLPLLAHLVFPVGVLEGACEHFVPCLSASARAVKTCVLARGSRLLRYQYSSRIAVTKSTEAMGVHQQNVTLLILLKST